MVEARRHPLVLVLAIIVFAECLVVGAATIYLVVEILVATASSLAGAVALTALVALAAIWLGFIGANILRGQSWTRAAAATWQVLQIAVAVGCFQGLFARSDVGWALLVPALAALVLLFTPPVVAATSRREPRQ